MISMLRKETCSRSIDEPAYISTRTCSSDCLTKSSAKADNLITAVIKRRLSEVDVHPNFRTLMEHEAFLSAWCWTFMHTREKSVFFLNDLKIALSPAPREGPYHVKFVRTSMDSESQDATKIMSALEDPRIYSFMKIMTLYMCIVAITIFLSISLSFSPSVVTISTSRTTGVCRFNRWMKNSAEHAERIENYHYESLAFSRHKVDVEFSLAPDRASF